MADKPLIQDFSGGIDNIDKVNARNASNEEEREKTARAKPKVTEVMQKETQKLLGGSFSMDQLNKSKYVADLAIVDDFNNGEAGIEDVISVFDKLLIEGNISGDEYDILCNQAVDGEEISIMKYISGNDIGESESEEQKENKEKLKELEQYKEYPSFPIIERFVQLSENNDDIPQMISDNDLLELCSHFNDNEDQIEGLKKSLDKSNFENPISKEFLHGYLERLDKLNTTKEVDSDGNYGIPEELKNLPSYDILEKSQDTEAVQLVLQNYMRFPEGGNEGMNTQKDLETAFKLTLNKVIDKKSFTPTEGYNIAVYDIQNGTLEEKIKGMAYIYSLVNTNQGMKGAKSNSAFSKMKQARNLKEVEKNKFNDTQVKSLAFNVDKQNEQKSDVIIDSSEVKEEQNYSKGDVFSGNSKLDGENKGNDSVGENT